MRPPLRNSRSLPRRERTGSERTGRGAEPRRLGGPDHHHDEHHGERHDGRGGEREHADDALDAHVWLDPHNATAMVRVMVAELLVGPERYFGIMRANAKALRECLQEYLGAAGQAIENSGVCRQGIEYEQGKC